MIISAVLATLPVCCSAEQIRSAFPISREDEPVVADAIRRWSSKGGGARSMEWRVPFVFRLEDRRCVVLDLIVPAKGGVPAYCYEIKSDELISVHDKVE